jgi:hypothetical protein
MLKEMIEIARQKVDILEFVSSEQLERHNTRRGMWADASPTNEPDKHLLLIWVDKDMSDTNKTITIAHELGHVRNFVEDFKRDLDYWGSLSWSPSVTMIRERAAWLYAIDYLKQVEFADWEFFMRVVSYSYGTYCFNVWGPYERVLIKSNGRKPFNRVSKANFLSEVKRKIGG